MDPEKSAVFYSTLDALVKISNFSDPIDVSNSFYDFIRRHVNKTRFELFMKSKLSSRDFMLVIKLFISVFSKPSDFRKFNLIQFVILNEFFDSMVNYLRGIYGSKSNEFMELELNKKTNETNILVLVSFFEVIVQFLPLCEVTYQKIIALMEMIIDCVIPSVFDEYSRILDERCGEILNLLNDKLSMLDRSSLFYTDIDLYPSQVDLYEKRNLVPNIVFGPYKNSEDYLNIHFKLLREDFIESVQKDLEELRTKPIIEPIKGSNVWLYKNVSARFLTSTNSKICHKLFFSDQDKSILKKEDWEVSKKFMIGSLLFFSVNNFNTFFIATVELNDSDISKGHYIALTVSVVGNPHQLKLFKFYDVIEPRSFYLPYYHSMRILQTMNPFNFPFAEDILLVNSDGDLSTFIKNTKDALPFSYSGDDLDLSQVKALNAAMSKKFTLIQGPPGCGKSLLARKIISILSEDKSDNRPVLVVTKRNRCLDLILEPLVEVGLKIARIGKTKSELLEDFTLYNVINKQRSSTPAKKFIHRAMTKLRQEICSKKNIRFGPKLETAVNKFNRASEASFFYRNYCDGQQLLEMKVQVIGTTTTGAAKRNSMLNAINPKAVIIEEAAEVLESYVITSLPLSCGHLVLIGDHLQLPPMSNLRNKYNLQVSLFERLINNGKNFHSLAVQHRMRPEIAELISPLIYKDLSNHASVYELPHVKGVQKNVYFINHSKSDQEEGFGYVNTHEAQFLLSFANYLVKQGYHSSAITILAAYSAQQSFLIENALKYPLLLGMSIQTIDNYQGDENDIILISLVRSNGRTIGFLKDPTRINVALSRGKHGLFIIGNMKTLSRESSSWLQIKRILEKRYSLGPEMPLVVCSKHAGIKRVSVPEEIDKLVCGKCTEIGGACDLKLECGHYCELKCNDSSNLNKNSNCKKPCQRMRSCGRHTCKKLCFEDCNEEFCEEIIDISLKCGHKTQVKCSADVSEIQCLMLCLRKCSCDVHICYKICHYPVDRHPCGTCTETTLPCGHIVKSSDGRKSPPVCNQLIRFTFSHCGHSYLGLCGNVTRPLPKSCDKCKSSNDKFCSIA